MATPHKISRPVKPVLPRPPRVGGKPASPGRVRPKTNPKHARAL